MSQRTLGDDINSFGIFDIKGVGGEIRPPFSRYVLHKQNSICCFATRKKGIYIISKFCLQNYIEFAGRKYIELAGGQHID